MLCTKQIINQQHGRDIFVSRAQPNPQAKSYCCACMRNQGHSLSAIGKVMGLDHATVHYHANTVAERLRLKLIKIEKITESLPCFQVKG